MLLAGTGRSDITPAPGTPQGGWGAQTHTRGIAADMPFYATALSLTQGAERFVLVDADAIGFNAEWTGRIVDEISRAVNLDAGRIRFSCTHTHSGPNTFRLANIAEGRDMAEAYLESLPHRIAGAAWQACQNMQPVRVSSARGTCGINVNRRVRVPDGRVVVGMNEDAPADPSLRVVRLDGLDGTPVAVLLHYACHGTTIAWQSRHFTPDFPGPARQTVEREIGGRCLFLQGAAGDMGPRRGFTGDLRLYHQLGTELGLAAAALALPLAMRPTRLHLTGVLPSGANIALYREEAIEQESPVFTVRSRKIAMPVRTFPPLAEMQSDLQRLRAEVEKHRAAGDEAAHRLALALATQAGWRTENAITYSGRTHTEWPLQAVRLGPIALVSVAGEPFSALGRRIAEASPFAETLFSGYSNGGFGYIPERSAYAEGGYEIEATPFSEAAGDVLVDESVSLLRELWDDSIAD